jgi:hypothetical protein
MHFRTASIVSRGQFSHEFVEIVAVHKDPFVSLACKTTLQREISIHLAVVEALLDRPMRDVPVSRRSPKDIKRTPAHVQHGGYERSFQERLEESASNGFEPMPGGRNSIQGLASTVVRQLPLCLAKFGKLRAKSAMFNDDFEKAACFLDRGSISAPSDLRQCRAYTGFEAGPFLKHRLADLVYGTSQKDLSKDVSRPGGLAEPKLLTRFGLEKLSKRARDARVGRRGRQLPDRYPEP